MAIVPKMPAGYRPADAVMLVRGFARAPSVSESHPRSPGRTPPSRSGFTLMRATAMAGVPAREFPGPASAAYPDGYVAGASAVSGEVMGLIQFPEGGAAAAMASVAKGDVRMGGEVDVRAEAPFEQIAADWASLASSQGAEVVWQVDSLVEAERVGVSQMVAASVEDLREIPTGDPEAWAFEAVSDGMPVRIEGSDPGQGERLRSYSGYDGRADVIGYMGEADYGPVILQSVSVDSRMIQLMATRDEANYALATDADAAKWRARGEVTPTAAALRGLAGAVSQPVFKRDGSGRLRESGRAVGKEALARSFAWDARAKFRSVSLDVAQVSGRLRGMVRPVADIVRRDLGRAVTEARGRSVRAHEWAHAHHVEDRRRDHAVEHGH